MVSRLLSWDLWAPLLEKGIASHCSNLAWRITGTEEPCGLQSMGLQRVGHDWSDFAGMHARTPLANKLNLRRVLPELWISSWWVRSTGDNMNLQVASGVGGGSSLVGLIPSSVESEVFSQRYVQVKVTQSVRLFATPWTVEPMEFSRPEY